MRVSDNLGWQPGDDFSELVERYAGDAFNLAYWMLGDSAEAEDAAQEAFLRAYTRLSSYDPTRSPFRTWLLSIASNHCIDRLRKRHVTLPSIDESLFFHPALVSREVEPEQAAIVGERNALVQSLLADLAPRYRAVIVLRYWYDMSYREIADTLETTVCAVRSLLFRARRLLAEVVLADADFGGSYDDNFLTIGRQPDMSGRIPSATTRGWSPYANHGRGPFAERSVAMVPIKGMLSDPQVQ